MKKKKKNDKKEGRVTLKEGVGFPRWSMGWVRESSRKQILDQRESSEVKDLNLLLTHEILAMSSGLRLSRISWIAKSPTDSKSIFLKIQSLFLLSFCYQSDVSLTQNWSPLLSTMLTFTYAYYGRKENRFKRRCNRFPFFYKSSI